MGNLSMRIRLVFSSMISGGSVPVTERLQWDSSSRTWLKAGQVVDAVGSNRKQLYEGKEYDYVFDVDIQEGVPPLKLPYNASGMSCAS
jgi:hypothetical protein